MKRILISKSILLYFAFIALVFLFVLNHNLTFAIHTYPAVCSTNDSSDFTDLEEIN